MLKVPIAVVEETGELVHISEYQDSLHLGTMLCPGCRGVVVPKAVRSDKKAAHFAHLSLDVCHGYESALHEWAKNQFENLIGKRLALPSVMESVLGKRKLKELRKRADSRFLHYRTSIEADMKERGIRLGGWHLKDYCKGFKSVDDWIRDEFIRFVGRPAEELERPHSILIESAEVEVPIDGGTVVADVLLNGRYNVEIFVTHQVDEVKESFLREVSLDTLEIDLPRDQKILFDKDAILKLMLQEVSNKNVYGHFEDADGDRFGISLIDIQAFAQMIEDKAEAMVREDYEHRLAMKASDYLRLSEVLARLESDPKKFFLDYIFNPNLCCRDSEYSIKRAIEASLKDKGFPLYHPDGRRKYAYDSPGTIVEVLSVIPYNRLKVKVTVIAEFEELACRYTMSTTVIKSESETFCSTSVGRRFKSVKNGWQGEEFTFE